MKMSSKAEELQEFILGNIDFFEFESWGSTFDEVPGFDLYARDYLQYAERELNLGTETNLINCISHLRRALDCQIDSYLHTFNLLQLVRDRNLGLDKKLEFLNSIGVFSSRSLSRFNALRNKMEHEYEIPDIEDIDVYFDLVSAFISLLERASLITSDVEGYISNRPFGYKFTFEYHREKICIEGWGEYVKELLMKGLFELTEGQLIACAKDDIKEFAFFFRVLNLVFLLSLRKSSTAFVKAQIGQKAI